MTVERPIRRTKFPGDERETRHILLGVSHPSGDPARHRTFEIRATYDAALGGWSARFGEKNANDQIARWGARLMDHTTPATCLGNAVTTVVALVECEAED